MKIRRLSSYYQVFPPLSAPANQPVFKIKGKKDRMEENSSIFFQNVINGYKKLALNNPGRYFIIDGVLKEDIIHNFIWDKINERCEL